MQLAVDTHATDNVSVTRNNTPVRRASCHTRNDTAGIRVGAPAWACVHTYPQAEYFAEANLRAKGYETWLPLVRIRRRDRVVRTMWHNVEVPAYSRYVLVLHRPDEPWTPIRYTEGIRDLVKVGSRPAHASDMAVKALRSLLETSLHSGERQDTGFAPGTPLRWITGALKGLDAIALNSNTVRTTVSVIMLGQLRTLVVPTASLAPRD